MRVLWIELRDFRNHAETRVVLPEGVVVALGPNGEGKTNLLEGVYYLLALSSPRVSSDLPLVRRGAVQAYVRGEADTLRGRLLIEVQVQASGANRVHVNRSPTRRRRDLRRLARAVFFGPADVGIVHGEPEERRGFLAEAVEALWPVREAVSRAYERALRQRNRLLKDWQGGPEPVGLAAWDGELVKAGSDLTRLRREALTRVAEEARREFEALSGTQLEVEYRPSVRGEPEEEAFWAALAARRDEELARRTTLVGPHRDDVGLSVRELAARGFASHGEAWGAAMSLKLGLAAAVWRESGEPPVLVLDDPFSGLDPVRRARLAERLGERGQVVISTADPAQVPPGASVLEVRAGRVLTPPRAAAGAPHAT